MLNREEVHKYYNYFKIKEGTEIFEVIESFVNNFSTKGSSMKEFEEKLGIVSSCMDMDLYKKEKDYYMILNLRKNNKDEDIHFDLKEITFEEFMDSIGTDYEHYGFVGTSNFHKSVLVPLLK